MSAAVHSTAVVPKFDVDNHATALLETAAEDAKSVVDEKTRRAKEAALRAEKAVSRARQLSEAVQTPGGQRGTAQVR